MSLPVTGQLNWGIPLNAQILSDENQLATDTNSITNHEGNNPPDPHGDRAYTQALVSPITTGTNLPGGYVVLNSAGKIPLNLVPVGAGLTNWIDAIPNYNVPFQGTQDASASLNAALTATNQAGGGIVFIGNGQFALASPLVIFPNTWLICSPGAIFTRINLTTPPFAMIQNYGSGVVPGNGNIRITGGTWDIATLPGHSGVMFSFVNADFIIIEDLGVIAYCDGNSPIGQLFGCGNVTLDNIQISGGPVINSGRGNQHFPCFRIEECNSTNIPGLPNVCYTFLPCSNIVVRGCSHSCGLLSDSLGSYSCFTSFCGTKGILTGANIHINISITGGCYGSGFAIAAIETFNWSNLTCTGNNFNFPQFPYVANWQSISPLISTFIFDTNSPRCYSPAVATCQNTITETIICQFTIPPNDWLSTGSGDGQGTCYKHHHSGYITCPVGGGTLTIKIYVGNLGTTGDTLCETIVINFPSACAAVPYACHHKGFDIDNDGGWIPCGSEFHCSANPSSGQPIFHCGSVRPFPTPGQQCFVTHTAKWDTANASKICQTKRGHHERHKQ